MPFSRPPRVSPRKSAGGLAFKETEHRLLMPRSARDRRLIPCSRSIRFRLTVSGASTPD